jgi:hypothetical protein
MPPAQQVTTAYDLRSIKAIVDVLALDRDDLAPVLETYANGWNVDIIGLSLRDQLRVLSRHAQDHARGKITHDCATHE